MFFDSTKLMEQVERQAGERILKASENAKRSLGPDGDGITVTRLDPPQRDGSHVTYATYSFPNEDLARRFKEALRREGV